MRRGRPSDAGGSTRAAGGPGAGAAAASPTATAGAAAGAAATPPPPPAAAAAVAAAAASCCRRRWLRAACSRPASTARAASCISSPRCCWLCACWWCRVTASMTLAPRSSKATAAHARQQALPVINRSFGPCPFPDAWTGAKRGWPLHWRAAEHLGRRRTAAESGVARAPRGAGGAALTPCCPRARQARQALDTGPWAGRFGVPRPRDLACAGRAGWQRLAARGLGERRRRPSARYVAARKPQAGQNGGRDCPQRTASDDRAALPVSSLRCVAAWR